MMRLSAAALGAVLTTLAAAGAAHGQAAELRLPDLVQEAPLDLRLETIRDSRGGRRYRLGFRSAVHNAGTGPLVIRGHRRSVRQRTMTADQLVQADDGSQHVRRAVGRLHYHRDRDHAHWHLRGFQRYELRGEHGARLGVRDRKAGFCLLDRYNVDFFTRSPFEPEVGAFTHECGRFRPRRLAVIEGISVGYGDFYEPHLEGQYVDVTNLPAGRYTLVHRVDADGRLLESERSNNVASALVRIRRSPRGGRPRVALINSCPGRATCPLGRREVMP